MVGHRDTETERCSVVPVSFETIPDSVVKALDIPSVLRWLRGPNERICA
jgi:hypothetical protein